ncbi:G-type lectin S-receptor-like serine/threonine-protein kinase SD2-5 [Senna tora]|uniref:G-type lectin S-receptor-like serine/threonine-protein kinase SD2-5 n=1 Tax=Senna tora TaxID=362788 RepID=A0A834XF61_9FABA|nr:G-type lectin S-receptor-like serine/threonine-protein kinase SD2-5 [Senna tora]
MANEQHISQLYPGFKASQVDWKDHNGLFLVSNSSVFAFGFFGYETPQIYWSTNVSKKVHSASLVSNSWDFYDQNGDLLWKSVFTEKSNDPKAMFAAILEPNGVISFYDLNKGKSVTPETMRIPQDPCGIPEPCDPYYVCFFENWCECPKLLKSRFNCKLPNTSLCSRTPKELIYVGEKLDYFALKYVQPVSKSNLSACRDECLRNCSCRVLFFENSTGKCFHFDQTGSFQRYKGSSGGYVSYMKVSIEDNGDGRNGRNNATLVVVAIVMLTILVIVGLVMGFWYYKKKYYFLENSAETLEEDDFLDNFPGMPTRFRYSILSKATKSFSSKIGEGGFGSVYLGVLEDGTQLAVKKLEGLGQGTKEFKAEVSSIGSIHHVHLVKLKGFCAEGPHRLLVYEYMGREKSDVYSFGMVLLEIIGGRRNYDQWEGSEKAHFPSYAFRMMEEGKLKQVLDPKIDIDESDERAVTAIKVALWCVQDDMNSRPSMTKVVQMLEGVCPAPDPPSSATSSTFGSYAAFLKMSSGEASSSGQASFYSNVPMSCVQLSGPR